MAVKIVVKIIIFIFFLPGWTFSQPAVEDNSVSFAIHKGPIDLYPLPGPNSVYRETNLSITPDGKYLYFMSLRGGMPWSVEGYSTYKGQLRYDGDIWFTRKRDGVWQPAECLPPTINTSNAEDEPNISPDGNYVMYQSWRDSWYTEGGPYYIAELFGEAWSKPEPMKGGINLYFKRAFRKHNGYATDGAALSPDQSIFMVAVAPEYEDSMDIRISRMQPDGIWSYLEETEISTPGDERSLFIAGDNKTIYFASDGYPGYGGLDIFKTVLHDNGTFGEIINIGKPFNTPEDDYNFITTGNGDEAYFIRNGDIYYADIRNAVPSIKPLPSVLLSGQVNDIYGRPVESKIILEHLNTGEIKGRAKSNSKTGRYALSFYRESGDYRQTFKADNMKELNRKFSIDSTVDTEKIEINAELLDPNMLLIHYEFDKYNLDSADKGILDSLARELYKNRRLRLLITGHTDEKGTEEYNLELSKNRMLGVVNYLNDRGIPRSIMKVDYYGETRPRVREGYNKDAVNRRVEIKVIELRKK